MRTLILVALILVTHAANTLPDGCVATASWEDGSAFAYCAAHDVWLAYDPDGQPYANEAGVPTRGIGWFVVSD